jgi:hypothetical protein
VPPANTQVPTIRLRQLSPIPWEDTVAPIGVVEAVVAEEAVVEEAAENRSEGGLEPTAITIQEQLPLNI